MPAMDYLPAKDGDLSHWLGNFITVANANLSTLHLTATDLQPVQLKTGAFNTDTADIAAAKQAAKAATQARHVSRKTVVADVRALVKGIQALPDVPDSLKTQLGITVTAGRRPQVPVYQPTMLTATIKPDMRVFVKWNKNGNHYGCLYVVERKLAGEAAWAQIKAQTASRFYDDTCPPGTNATYRVTATRGALNSMPSASASVY